MAARMMASNSSSTSSMKSRFIRVTHGSYPRRRVTLNIPASRSLNVTTRRFIPALISLKTSAIKFPTNHEQSQFETFNFLDNEFVPSTTSTWFHARDPAADRVVTRTPQSSPEELQAAVDSARNAFPAWKATSILHREAFMFKFIALVRENWDRLAASITLEQGKTVADAKGDVLRGLQVAEQACGITTQLTGKVLEVSKDMETRSYRLPLGVVASICPFNFPAMIPLWSIANALITGNTLLLKPSERTPGAALILAELARRAGIPPGVLNIIHGAVPTVDFILDSPDIKAISFIGGNKAGEYIYTRGSANGKRVQANLGAKNHVALLPDADKSHALNAISGAAFGAAGQRCMALSTLVTVGNANDWLPEIKERAEKLTVNGGFENGADIGPVISREAKERIEAIIQSAEDEGTTILLDGRGHRPDKYRDGYFIGPTIITNVTPSMTCYKEEIFGPVLIHLAVPNMQSAIDLINANPYGNGTAIFTTSGSNASYFQQHIEAGTVGINVPIPVPLPMFSFTGNKKSIAGGGGNYFLGEAGLNFYTQLKTVTSLWRRQEDTIGKQVAEGRELKCQRILERTADW